MAIKNIIFDIGNVLVDFRYNEYMRDLGIPKEAVKELEDKVILGGLWDQLDLGIMKLEDIYEEMKKAVPLYSQYIDIIFDDNNIIDIVRPYDYAKDWIKSVKDKGYKVYLLTNYPDKMFAIHEREGRFPFISYADGKVVSARVKMSKPDSSIYELLLDKYKLNASECMFFDDRVKNVETAKKLGIDARIFKSYEEAKAMIP